MANTAKDLGSYAGTGARLSGLLKRSREEGAPSWMHAVCSCPQPSPCPQAGAMAPELIDGVLYTPVSTAVVGGRLRHVWCFARAAFCEEVQVLRTRGLAGTAWESALQYGRGLGICRDMPAEPMCAALDACLSCAWAMCIFVAGGVSLQKLAPLLDDAATSFALAAGIESSTLGAWMRGSAERIWTGLASDYRLVREVAACPDFSWCTARMALDLAGAAARGACTMSLPPDELLTVVARCCASHNQLRGEFVDLARVTVPDERAAEADKLGACVAWSAHVRMRSSVEPATPVEPRLVTAADMAHEMSHRRVLGEYFAVRIADLPVTSGPPGVARVVDFDDAPRGESNADGAPGSKRRRVSRPCPHALFVPAAVEDWCRVHPEAYLEWCSVHFREACARAIEIARHLTAEEWLTGEGVPPQGEIETADKLIYASRRMGHRPWCAPIPVVLALAPYLVPALQISRDDQETDSSRPAGLVFSFEEAVALCANLWRVHALPRGSAPLVSAWVKAVSSPCVFGPRQLRLALAYANRHMSAEHVFAAAAAQIAGPLAYAEAMPMFATGASGHRRPAEDAPAGSPHTFEEDVGAGRASVPAGQARRRSRPGIAGKVASGLEAMREDAVFTGDPMNKALVAVATTRPRTTVALLDLLWRAGLSFERAELSPHFYASCRALSLWPLCERRFRRACIHAAAEFAAAGGTRSDVHDEREIAAQGLLQELCEAAESLWGPDACRPADLARARGWSCTYRPPGQGLVDEPAVAFCVHRSGPVISTTGLSSLLEAGEGLVTGVRPELLEVRMAGEPARGDSVPVEAFRVMARRLLDLGVLVEYPDGGLGPGAQLQRSSVERAELRGFERQLMHFGVLTAYLIRTERTLPVRLSADVFCGVYGMLGRGPGEVSAAPLPPADLLYRGMAAKAVKTVAATRVSAPAELAEMAESVGLGPGADDVRLAAELMLPDEATTRALHTGLHMVGSLMLTLGPGTATDTAVFWSDDEREALVRTLCDSHEPGDPLPRGWFEPGLDRDQTPFLRAATAMLREWIEGLDDGRRSSLFLFATGRARAPDPEADASPLSVSWLISGRTGGPVERTSSGALCPVSFRRAIGLPKARNCFNLLLMPSFDEQQIGCNRWRAGVAWTKANRPRVHAAFEAMFDCVFSHATQFGEL